MAASRVARGDLAASVEVASNEDVLGLALNNTTEQLSGLITDIRSTSDEVAGASKDLSNSAQHSASTCEAQADSTDSVLRSVKEMLESFHFVRNGARELTALASRSGTDVSHGQQSVDETLQAISCIADAVDVLAKTIEEIESKAIKVISSLEVIQDIAAETTTLSLNASIQASRAGEHGKGFAIVAEAVRKLAERSTKSADEIESLITHMDTAIKNAGSNMQAARKEVNQGTKLAESMDQVFSTVATNVHSTLKKAEHIRLATRDQTQAAEEVAESMQNFRELVDMMSAASKETASTAQALAKNADALSKAIHRFKVGSKGNGAPTRPSEPGLTAQPAPSDPIGAAVPKDFIH